MISKKTIGSRISSMITPRSVLILGFIVSFGVTLSEVLRGKNLNFKIFAYSTQDFWNGINPYGAEWWRHGLDYFLYAPPFSVLFLPWAVMPEWLGAFAWNLFNYGLYALAIYTLPKLSQGARTRILLYTIPILATSQLSFQYNVSVAYMFLFAFSLLERGQGRWAMLLIMISAMTKIYGGLELLLLLLYPNFLRNAMWGIIWGVILFSLPMLKLAPAELIPYYGDWINALSSHHDTRPWETIFDIKLIWKTHPPYQTAIQLGVITVISALTLWRMKWRRDFNFRVGVLAVVMGYVIFFSNSSEKHTYIIALAGYLYWWWAKARHTRFDRVLYWSILVVMVLVPIDLICPAAVMHLIFDTLDLNKWLFLVAWLYLCYSTFFINHHRDENNTFTASLERL